MELNSLLFKKKHIRSNASLSWLVLCWAVSPLCPSCDWIFGAPSVVAFAFDAFKLRFAVLAINSWSDVSFAVALDGIVTLDGSSIDVTMSWLFFVRCLYVSAAADMWLNHLWIFYFKFLKWIKTKTKTKLNIIITNNDRRTIKINRYHIRFAF